METEWPIVLFFFSVPNVEFKFRISCQNLKFYLWTPNFFFQFEISCLKSKSCKWTRNFGPLFFLIVLYQFLIKNSYYKTISNYLFREKILRKHWKSKTFLYQISNSDLKFHVWTHSNFFIIFLYQISSAHLNFIFQLKISCLNSKYRAWTWKFWYKIRNSMLSQKNMKIWLKHRKANFFIIFLYQISSLNLKFYVATQNSMFELEILCLNLKSWFKIQ